MKEKIALVLPQKTGGTHIEKAFTEAGVNFVFLPSLTEDDTWDQKSRKEREVKGLVNPKHFSFSGFDSDRCTIDSAIGDEYIKIGLIRNPYEWLQSWIFHNMEDRIDRWDCSELDEFILKFCSGYVPKRQKNTMVNACEDYPMHHIFNPDGTIACDFLIYNENLNQGINKLFASLDVETRMAEGSKTLKGSYDKEQVFSIWTPAMKAAVQERFGDFLELFGYGFPGESEPVQSSLVKTEGLQLKNFQRMR